MQAQTSARAVSGPSSTGWCSHSLRTPWQVMATPPITTGRPRFPAPHSPRALPGASTPLLCTIRPGTTTTTNFVQFDIVACHTESSFLSMPAMGFNMGCLQSASTMNSSSIMPSVTSISSSLATPAPPYGSPSHSSSHYPMYGKDSVTGYPCMTSSIASLR